MSRQVVYQRAENERGVKEDWRNATRARIAIACKARPDLCDARFVKIPSATVVKNVAEEMVQEVGPLVPPVSLGNFFK